MIALIQGSVICYTPLHQLEFTNALQLKVFLKSATPTQVAAAQALIAADLTSGVLVAPGERWDGIFSEAVKLAEQHTGIMGCRSLDVLHCAAAKTLSVSDFISTDARQKKLAVAIGLNLLTF